MDNSIYDLREEILFLIGFDDLSNVYDADTSKIVKRKSTLDNVLFGILFSFVVINKFNANIPLIEPSHLIMVTIIVFVLAIYYYILCMHHFTKLQERLQDYFVVKNSSGLYFVDITEYKANISKVTSLEIKKKKIILTGCFFKENLFEDKTPAYCEKITIPRVFSPTLEREVIGHIQASILNEKSEINVNQVSV